MGVWKQDGGTEVITDPDSGEVIEDDEQGTSTRSCPSSASPDWRSSTRTAGASAGLERAPLLRIAYRSFGNPQRKDYDMTTSVDEFTGQGLVSEELFEQLVRRIVREQT